MNAHDNHHNEHSREHHDQHDHDHGSQGHGHGHTHGVVDPSITTSERGIWAIKWSFIGLFITAAIQIFVVYLSKSVGLLADTIHNFGDAATAIPLWVAFALARWKPSKRFTYGYGRVEDLAGVAIVLTITFGAVVAGYESIRQFMHPQPVGHLWAVMAASIVGFIGNEAVAIFRIKVGKEIQSAALVANGYHARHRWLDEPGSVVWRNRCSAGLPAGRFDSWFTHHRRDRAERLAINQSRVHPHARWRGATYLR
jgi:Co/Zn/Cd efflux system component